jgi:sugar-specific transcriptional regulator TrmB
MLERVGETDIYREIELLYKQGIDKIEPSELSGVLKGRKNVYDHLKTIISNAEKSVSIMTTEKGFIRKIDLLKSALKKAKMNGIKIKIVAPIKESSFLSKEVKDSIEIRTADENTKARFVLVDGKELLFMMADDNEIHEAYDTGIWVKTPYFAQALNQMFELNWKGLKRL